MDVKLISYTKIEEKTITEYLTKIAKRCYCTKHFDNIEIDYDKAKKLLEKIIKSGHLSILEHYSFTFSIEDVSVALLGQLTRNRLASFTVQSLRYNNMKDSDINVSIPEGIKYDDLNEIYLKSISESYNNYNKLIEKGYKPEQARYVLPQGIRTNLIMTMNVRELFHFFDLRYCNRADNEIHQLAIMIYFLVNQKDNYLFSFVKHSCQQCKNKCEKYQK